MSWSAIANINAPPPAGAKAVPAGSSSSTTSTSLPSNAAATSTKPSNNATTTNNNTNNNNTNNNNNNKGERRNNNNNNNNNGAANGHAKKDGNNNNNNKGYENKEKQDKPASAAEIKLQGEIDAAGKQITTVKQQLETLSGELKIREKARSDVQREVTQVKNKLRELQGRKQKLFDQKKAVRDKIKLIQETRRARDEQIRDAKSALKLKKVHDSLELNLKQVDDEVAKLEAAMETTTLSIQEEKARVGQIAAFRKTKDEIRAYHALVDTLTQEADNKQLGDQLRAFDTEINSFKGRESELTKELDRLRGKLDSKDADVPSLLNQRRTLFAELDAAHQAQTQARAALQKLRRDLYNQRQAARAAREAENKAYVAAKKDEERKRQEQREAAELLVVPLADEIELCDSLIQYLQPYRPVVAPATTAAAPAAAATNSTGGEAAIRKMAAELGDGAEVVVLRGNAKGGAGRAGGNKAAKRTAARNGGKINHHITTFGDFHRLSLLPPPTIADVDATIEQLQKKKAEFQQQSAEKMAARASALAAKKAAAAAAAAAAPQDKPADGDAAAAAAAAASTSTDKPIAGDEDGDLLAMFKAADKDATGTLSREEFSAVLSKLAQFDTPEKVAAAVAKADKNGDGKITYAEYVALANDDD